MVLSDDLKMVLICQKVRRNQREKSQATAIQNGAIGRSNLDKKCKSSARRASLGNS